MIAGPPVLLLDATWYGTLAAVRNLGAHGVRVTLASDSTLAPARWSRYVTQYVACPSSSDAAGLLSWLLQFGAAQPGHVLIATSDNVAWLVAAHAAALSEFFQVYTPTVDALAQLLDKGRLMDAAEAAGLDQPGARVPRDEADVISCGQEMGFPLYVKPRGQLFGRGLGKGIMVKNVTELTAAWRAQYDGARYDAEVLDRLPDLCLPLVQTCAPETERIYAVDGFIDETAELYVAMACRKLLQRPRGSGIGIVFEHCELDPAVAQGLRRLFQATGFHGVFDVEFLESGSRKLLIDINPRFYNHIAFETERGMHLPWLAYLAATRNRQALAVEIENAARVRIGRRVYVHRLSTTLLLAAQRLRRSLSAEGYRRWRQWIAEFGSAITEPVRSVRDPLPAIVEVVVEAVSFMRHPRSYLRELWSSPNRTLAPPPLTACGPPQGPLAQPTEASSE